MVKVIILVMWIEPPPLISRSSQILRIHLKLFAITSELKPTYYNLIVRIMLSNETRFTIDEFVNKQNCRIRREKN